MMYPLFGFADTKEALEYGKRCTEKDRRQLRKARRLLLKYSKAQKKDNPSLAMLYATQAQFCREALEISEKKGE